MRCARRSTSTTSMRSASTVSTARSSTPSSNASTGGPVGLNTLAVSVGEEAETIESVVEPFLVRIGLLSRTPRGRVATPAAWRHFGMRSPRSALTATIPDG